MQTRQPQYVARIDRANPLAQGLSFWSYGTGKRSHAPTTVALGGSTVPIGGGQVGYVASGAANNRWPYDPSWSNHAQASGFTAFCEFYKTGNAASLARIFGRTALDAAAPPYLNWDFELNPSGSGQDKCAANISTTSAPFFLDTVNIDNIVTGRNTVAISVTSAGFTGYSQGVSRNSAAVTPNNSVTGADDIYIGGYAPAGSQDTGSVVTLCLAWARPLSNSEHRLLNANPWQVFEASQRILVDVASVAAGGKPWLHYAGQMAA